MYRLQSDWLRASLLHLKLPAFLNKDETRTTDTTIVSTSEFVVTNLVADIREFSEFSQDRASSKVCLLIREIFDRFSAIVGKDTVPTVKPAPDIFFKMLDVVGCDAYECVVIEVAEKGMHAAIAAHIPVMVVRTRETQGFDFGLADLVFDSHAEMASLFSQWAEG